MLRTIFAALAFAALLTGPARAADPAEGRGPYRIDMAVWPGLSHHTVYAPRDLTALGETHLPVVVWANGGCRDEGNRYRYFLTDIASRGYLVIALGRPASADVESGWPGDPVLPEGPLDLDAPAPTEPREMTQAIDWAIAQNADPASPLHGRLATDKIAVAGHSCGGLQALTVSTADPRISTTLMLNSGVWNVGAGGLPGARDVTKQSLAALHGSIIYISGEHDIALPNSRDDFARLSGPPAMLAYRDDVAHAGTYWLPNGGAYGTVAGEWLDWQLKGDAGAARWFVGEDCRLCVHPKWHVERKNIR